MSQIKPSRLIITLVMALALGGCGDKNSKAVFSPEGGHSSDWVQTHKTSARANIESCVECHGEKYDGGISKISCMSQSAVSGFACHATSPVVSQSGCISCHGGLPSGPYGVTAPNRKSAHTKHMALAGIVCETCHLNAGSGTAGHARVDSVVGRNIATVVLSPRFNSNNVSVPFGFNDSGSCSNISCHGGKATPDWAGSIAITAGVNSICLKCHEQRSSSGIQQYNSYYSGEYSGTNLHSYHLGADINANCTDCHKISMLTNFQQHYGGVATNTFTAPQQTIGGTPTKIESYVFSSKTCTTDCHTFVARIQNWIPAP